MTSRITELEQSLAASEARVVELERERDRLRECIKEEMKYRHLAYDAMYAAVELLSLVGEPRPPVGTVEDGR